MKRTADEPNAPRQPERGLLDRQHLRGATPAATFHAVVRDLVALHGTTATGPYLSLFARTDGFQRSMLDAALYEERSLVRWRCMRQTVFVVPRDLVPIVHAAMRRRNEAMSRRYLANSGVDPSGFDHVAAQLLEALTGRSAPVAELRRTIRSPLPVSSCVNLLCDLGLLVRSRPVGGWRSTTWTYGRVADLLPDLDLDAWTAEDAQAHLVRRYADAYGPVTLEDACWWGGFTKAQVRRAHAELAASPVPGAVAPEDGEVRLLPALDPYLMGYRDRSRLLAPDRRGYVFDRSGNAAATIVCDGVVVGVWDAVSEPAPTLRYHLFAPIPTAAVVREAHRVARFVFDAQARVERVEEMRPLATRPASRALSRPLDPT